VSNFAQTALKPRVYDFHVGRAKPRQAGASQHSLYNLIWSLIMPSRLPPIPPSSRRKIGSHPKISKDASVRPAEPHHNSAEGGETANIKQNTTNKGFFRGRQLG